ncbi:MAG: NAD(P)-binding domain-containing protein [Thermodesulfobacteriota bacterium]
MESTFQFLGSSSLGIFGAGYLGRAIIRGLLQAGFPKQRLVICHKGSRETRQKLAAAGPSGLEADRHEAVRRSKIVFYLVRPQDYLSMGGCTMKGDSLFVSFLAGASRTQHRRLARGMPPSLLESYLPLNGPSDTKI